MFYFGSTTFLPPHVKLERTLWRHQLEVVAVWFVLEIARVQVGMGNIFPRIHYRFALLLAAAVEHQAEIEVNLRSLFCKW